MSFLFENLPKNAQIAIFSQLSYSNLVKLRLVNRWFKEKCSNILNETFMRVKQDLEDEICIIFNEVKARETENEEGDVIRMDTGDLNAVSNIHLRYKVLQILKCEISVLQAVCERYVKLKVYSFTGGKILDYFYQIMNKNFNLTDAKNPLESYVTMQLFLLNEEFMDYFEEVMEPEIVKKNFCPWFGVKIADILDLYGNSNYHVVANYENQCLQISAKYEVLNPETATKLDFPQTSENLKKLVHLSRYIRNQMRWQNFFYYVDAPYESVKSLIGKRDRRYNKFCLNPAEMVEDGTAVYNSEEIALDKFKKTFNRRLGNPCSKENVFYGIELQCSKGCVPARLEPYIASITQTGEIVEDTNKANLTNPNDFLTLVNETTSSYDFTMTVKIVLPSEDKTFATENYVEIYHNNQVLKVIELSKEIPI